MSKWPAILTPVVGFAAVFVASSILLVSPCGPGCEWPVFAVTLLYSLLVLAFRFKVPVSRYTAIVLALISIAFLCERRYTQHRFGQELQERMRELRARAIETEKKTQETTAHSGGRD